VDVRCCQYALGTAVRLVYSTSVQYRITARRGALAAAVSWTCLCAGASAQSGWGEPLRPDEPKEPAPPAAPERSPAPETVEPVAPPATEPNPDWADAPPTEFEERSPQNPDWVEEDEPPPVGDQRDNASASYDIRYANRSLTMPRGMMRGTFDAVIGRREEPVATAIGDTGTIATLNLGAAITLATDFEIGFSRYRIGRFPMLSIIPDFGFGPSGLLSMIASPEVKFGDIPFYGRFQALDGEVAKIAIDAVFRIPSRSEFGFVMGVPLRFVAKERFAFDTGIDFNVDNNPNGPSVWSLTLPFSFVANVTDQVFLKLDSGMLFFDLSQTIRTATSGLIQGPFYFFPLGFGGGYTMEAGATMIDLFVNFRFPTLYGFTTRDSEVNVETWAITIGFNIHSPVLFKGSAL